MSKQYTLASKLLSEFIGTFALVFCGTGAIMVNDITGGAITVGGIAVVFGLIVMAMIYSFGHVSGAHINPAVSIGFWAAGRFNGKLVVPYIIAQLLGAILASVVLLILFPEHESLGATVPAGTVWQSFLLEMILTFFLMLVIMQVSTGPKEIGAIAGLAIGSVVLLEAWFAGPITGASMNPARSIAPALVSSNLQYLWVYITAPVLGAVIGILPSKRILTK